MMQALGSKKGAQIMTPWRMGAILFGAALLAAAAFAGSRFRTSDTRTVTVRGGLARVTAPVVRRTLISAITLDGRVVKGAASQVQIGSVDVPNGSPVVTRPGPAVGSVIENGSQIAEVGEEPVFALKGTVPTYRTLSMGAHGRDVTQLQEDLTALGFYGDYVTGVYDQETADAVAKWFMAHGYAAPTEPVSEPGSKGRRAAAAAVLPQAEVVFEPELPATVIGDREVVGAEIAKDPLTIASGPIDVQVALTRAQASVVGGGQRAVFRVGVAGWRAARVAGVAGDTATLAPIRPLAGQRIGAHVLIKVIFQDSRKPVLAVPAIAVQTSGDGAQFVLVTKGGRLHRVTVNTGLDVGGEVAVSPVDGTLMAGDRVALSS